MSDSEPDYLNIKIPEDKDPEDYTWAERRAEEIEYIKKYQDPELVPKSKLAERYGVSPPQITYDFECILEYLEKHGGQYMGRRVKVFLDNLFEDIVEKKRFVKAQGQKKRKEMTDEELRELYDFARDHAEWLMQLGRIERSADKVEVESEASTSIAEEIAGIREAMKSDDEGDGEE